MIPVDKDRCQAEKPNGESFMTIGGGHKMVRCSNKPTVIITETVAGKDGLFGSMSLCDDCLKVAEKQLPEGYIKVKSIFERLLIVYDKKDSEYVYMNTAWTDKELEFRWIVISVPLNEEAAQKEVKRLNALKIVNMETFPKFWYESNAYFSWVNSLEDLHTALSYQTDPKYGGLRTKDEFLDKSTQHYDGSLNFGTRIEHSGKKTLREYLVENNVEF
mgnify:FL=1